MVLIMKIYTKRGDKGSTSLFDGIKVSKDNIRVESYGTVDELTSWLGLSKNYVDDKRVFKDIETIQKKLFSVAASLASSKINKTYKITEDDVKSLENMVDYYINNSKELTGFVTPGENKKSAYLHVTRTICRRAERRIISLSEIETIDLMLIKYVNRLSDVIYSMAIYLEDK